MKAQTGYEDATTPPAGATTTGTGEGNTLASSPTTALVGCERASFAVLGRYSGSSASWLPQRLGNQRFCLRSRLQCTRRSEPACLCVCNLPVSMYYYDAASNLEQDLALSDDETSGEQHWPRLTADNHNKPSVASQYDPQPSTSTKQHRAESDDSSNECKPPVNKLKHRDTACRSRVSNPSATAAEVPPPTPRHPHPQQPAFALRDNYIKLLF